MDTKNNSTLPAKSWANGVGTMTDNARIVILEGIVKRLQERVKILEMQLVIKKIKKAKVKEKCR